MSTTIAGRLLNIHPSLLPKYPGLHTHRQVLENGDEEHGTSVHFVTDELDGGPVILQAKVPVFAGDNEDDVTARVQTQEHAIYPLVVSWFVDGRLEMRDGARLAGRRQASAAGLCGRRVVCHVAVSATLARLIALPEYCLYQLSKISNRNNICHTFLALLDISWKSLAIIRTRRMYHVL